MNAQELVDILEAINDCTIEWVKAANFGPGELDQAEGG